MSDQPGAIWMPNANSFSGRNGVRPQWVILHGTAGGSSAQNIATYFASTQGGPNPVSSHYVIGQDGTVVQCVAESDGAWANGYISTGHDAWWSDAVNPNNQTISIEHVKSSLDNSDALTPAQQAASFKLIHDICQRWQIPMRRADASGGITGHYSLDPVNRSDCPGPYNWNALWAYLNQPVVPAQRTYGGKPMALNPYMQADALKEWGSLAKLVGAQSYNSGIAASWRDMYSRGLRMGPVMGPEESSTDWSGAKIIVQRCMFARAEYNPANGSCNWYGSYGRIATN